MRHEPFCTEARSEMRDPVKDAKEAHARREFCAQLAHPVSGQNKENRMKPVKISVAIVGALAVIAFSLPVGAQETQSTTTTTQTPSEVPQTTTTDSSKTKTKYKHHHKKETTEKEKSTTTTNPPSDTQTQTTTTTTPQ
jgi:cytoskeletal protein RodZ